MVPAALNAVLYAFQPAAAVAAVELHFLSDLMHVCYYCRSVWTERPWCLQL